MHKLLFGIAALAAATAGNAAVVTVNLGGGGNLGNSHLYTAGGLSITATGYASNGNSTALFGKSCSGVCDENGLGLNGFTDNEINGPGTDFIQLDFTKLPASVIGATFFMGSTTDNEWWAVFGTNSLGTLAGATQLLTASDEGSHGLQLGYKYYDFVALGTKSCGWWGCSFSGGNVLIGGLTFTQAVPEPGTWAMMLLGFGAMGLAFRRSNTTKGLKATA